MKKMLVKLKVFVAILVLIGFCGCSNNPGKKAAKDQRDTTNSANPVIDKPIPNGCDTSAISDQLSYKALAFEVFNADTNTIKSLFLDPVILKMEKQTGEEGNEYYLYNFTDGVNKLQLFKNDGFYVENAEIMNGRIRLNKKISIGMNKDVFLKLVKLKNITCDTVNVEDEELTFSCVYIFKDARLQQIKMGQTLE